MRYKANNKVAPAQKVLAQIGEASRRRGTNKLTEREIVKEVASYRKEKQQSRSVAEIRKPAF